MNYADLEVKKPAVDTAYEPVDHNKTSAPSKKATQRFLHKHQTTQEQAWTT